MMGSPIVSMMRRAISVASATPRDRFGNNHEFIAAESSRKVATAQTGSHASRYLA